MNVIVAIENSDDDTEHFGNCCCGFHAGRLLSYAIRGTINEFGPDDVCSGIAVGSVDGVFEGEDE